MLRLESLANELILDLFDYLPTAQLFRAFHGLNSRFDILLVDYYRTHGFDFQSISKTDFDDVCQNHLPLVADCISSLHLLDNDETPQQIICFLSHNPFRSQFSHLKSLSLSHIHTQSIMYSLMKDLQSLPQLAKLRIIDCYFRSSYFNIVWLQPQLTTFALQKVSSVYVLLHVVSVSIRHLSITAVFDRLTSLQCLLDHTPHLQRLAIGRFTDTQFTDVSFFAPSIRTLALAYTSSLDQLDDPLIRFANLTRLTIRTKYVRLDGHRWENLIKDHLTQLNTFRLLMEFDTDVRTSGETQTDLILRSFRTPFWLIERQWFVRCHWDPLQSNKNYCLYTLPCRFEQYIRYVTAPFQSTCPDTLIYPLSSQLLHVRHLDLALPRPEQFWLANDVLPRLKSLSIQITNDSSAHVQLQSLLNRASHLHSLRLYSQHFSVYDVLTKVTSRCVRRLDLRSIYANFKEQTCLALSNTPIVRQCEVLLINVLHRASILLLLDKIRTLRALYVHCRDCVKLIDNLYFPTVVADELVEWLRERVPRTFAVASDEDFQGCIRLWIGN